MLDRLTSRAWLSGALALGLGLQVFAQSSATIVMRSGERHPAQNIGLFDGKELIVRTSFAEEPRFPVDQVAYIDFGDTPDSSIRFNGSQNAIMLRDGGVLRGQVTRIGHTTEDQKSPYQISFRTSAGDQRDLNGNDVARVYFNDPAGVAGATQASRSWRRGNRGVGTSGNDLRVINVPARQRWTSTGITVNQGDVLNLQSTGQIRLNRDGVSASPDGSSGNDARSPLPNVLVGALIGRIGSGQPFGIGMQGSITMPDSGQLFLGVNDSILNDNDGAFRVEIRTFQ